MAYVTEVLNQMKTIKTAGIVLVAIGVLALVGCGAKSNSGATTAQTAKVQRGNIVVATTSTGNLAFTQSEDVAFDMAGTVQQVMVGVGDSVKEGQVLATLDTSVWDDQIKTLRKAVTTAQRNLTTAERNIASQQLAVTQAQLNLQAGQNMVAAIPAVQSAQDLVDVAEAALTAAKGMYAADPNLAGPQIVAIQQQLAQAKQNLQSVLNGTSFNLSSDMALQIAKAQFSVQQNQFAFDSANVAVDNAKQARDDAAQTLEDAQSALSDAQALSPEVKAPFTGFVTSLSVEGGQEVKKGAVAVQIADPDRFEVRVLVGERDIASMAIGGLGTVNVDSMTGVSLPGRITAIAPTATIQQGVVNYQVTVEVMSSGGVLGQISGNGTGATPPALGNGGTQTPRFQGQGGQIPGISANQSGQGRTGTFPGSVQSASAQSAILRQGLSVTVNLVTAQKNNVLMVPNRAIVRQQGKTYVNLEQAGTTTSAKQVAVTIGISNSQYTEITEGVAEGDTVVLPITTTSTSTNSQQRGGALFPGGGILR